MDLYLIRHPQPAVEPGICYGQTDLPLRQAPESSAASIRARLPERYRLYSSPLRRCAALAEALGPAQLDERLAEMHFGRWEMRPWTELGAAALDAWQASGFGAELHGGEALVDFRRRVLDWLDGQRNNRQAVVAVTHAGVIRILLQEARGWSLDRALSYPLAYGEVQRLRLKTY